jgi:hypothetical protein
MWGFRGFQFNQVGHLIIQIRRRIICECFSQKGDLELLTGVTYEDYQVLVPALWDPIMAANLRYLHLFSFVSRAILYTPN